MDAQEPEEEKATKKKEFRFLSRLIVRLVDQKPEKKKKTKEKKINFFFSAILVSIALGLVPSITKICIKLPTSFPFPFPFPFPTNQTTISFFSHEIN